MIHFYDLEKNREKFSFISAIRALKIDILDVVFKFFVIICRVCNLCATVEFASLRLVILHKNGATVFCPPGVVYLQVTL